MGQNSGTQRRQNRQNQQEAAASLLQQRAADHTLRLRSSDPDKDGRPDARARVVSSATRPASHNHRCRDAFPTCFQREQLLVSSSPGGASRARGEGTSLDGTTSGCSTPMDSRTRLVEIAPPLAAIAGEVSKFPLLPSHRTTAATGFRAARAWRGRRS
jgi:hypothetical protein